MAGPEYVVHRDPVWRHRSDFIIMAPEPGGPNRYEQLWTRKLKDTEFELCCIPFFVYDLALGDTVEAGPEGQNEYLLKRVLKRSGHSTYRIWLGERPTDHRKILWELEGLGASFEQPSTNLVAVDAPNASIADQVWAMLAPLHEAGDLMLEAGWTPHRPPP